MMNLTTLSLSFWDYALESATHILNMVPTKRFDKTPYELWYGKVLNLSYLKVWGGYPKETIGYYFYFPPENKIFVARSERIRQAPNRLSLNVEAEEHSLGDLSEPTSYKAAMLDSESNKWIDTINAEIQSMMDNMVWFLVDLPPGCNIVGSKWIFKKKTDMDGIVHTYKSYLVAKSYTQLYGVDYEETFSPVADIRAIRILISIAAYYDYAIWKMDIKTSFLNGYLGEDIYMVQPEGLGGNLYCARRSVLSIDRYVFILNGGAVDWKSSKQSTTVMSATEAEYIAASKLRWKLFGLGSLFQGLRGARHYRRRYHYVRECIALGKIRFLKVHTDDNLADPFMKALPKGKLTQHAMSMGLRLTSSFM
ncbi:retrotransposon protein, putative, ty1-copia subclass [Tanacetum coccineum]